MLTQLFAHDLVQIIQAGLLVRADQGRPLQRHRVGDALVVERPNFRLRAQLRLDFFKRAGTSCIAGLGRRRFRCYIKHRMGTLHRLVDLLADFSFITFDAWYIKQLEMLPL